MSGSVSDSDACGNDWDNTWIPPTVSGAVNDIHDEVAGLYRDLHSTRKENQMLNAKIESLIQENNNAKEQISALMLEQKNQNCTGNSNMMKQPHNVLDGLWPKTNLEVNQITNPTTVESNDNFQKQFMVQKEIKVFVVKEEILKMNVTTVVCPTGYKSCSPGFLKMLKKFMQIEEEVRMVKASPATLPFQYTLRIISPKYDSSAEAHPNYFREDLECCIKSIIRLCSDKSDVSSLAIPVLGIGQDGYQTPISIFAKAFIDALIAESKKSRLDLEVIYVVTNKIADANVIADEFAKEDTFKSVTSFQRSRNKPDPSKKTTNEVLAVAGKTFKGTPGEFEYCVICMDECKEPRQLACDHVFCGQCIDERLKYTPECPTCGCIHGVITGKQPPGRMIIRESSCPLPGYSCKTIVIDYDIFAGVQAKEHPNPGKYFEGTTRTAYLPNNKQGKLITDLLKVAFDRRLVFTIGQSRTTGKEGVVTWNDIHHKTSTQHGHQFGYPDEGYLDRVMDELKVKGITEKDIKTKH